jgi:ferritin
METIYKDLWTTELENALNKQIETLLSNFATFEELANHFSNFKVALPGMAKLLRHEANNELNNARNLMNYQNNRGGTVDKVLAIASDITTIENSDNNMIDCYKFILETQKNTYNSLLELHELAVNDPTFQNMLVDILNDQLTIHKTLHNTIKKLENGGNIFCLLHDNELDNQY